MNFASLVNNAVETKRGTRLNDNVIVEATIAGLTVMTSRKSKNFAIAEFHVDKSVGKPAGKFESGVAYDAGIAHVEGQVVSEMINLSEDWGPGKVQSLLFKALGIQDKKQVPPEQLEALIAKAPRKGTLTPDGINAVRGVRIRIEMVPYTTKGQKDRFITSYSTIPMTPEELAASKARLDSLGVE